MSDQDPDFWPPAAKPAPDLRRQLLKRLATDLSIVASEDHLQRPADMQCCWVRYELVPGARWVAFICEGRRKPQGGAEQPCPHQHHKDDVLYA